MWYYTTSEVIRIMNMIGAETGGISRNPAVGETVAFQGVSFTHVGGGDWTKGH